MNIDLIEKFANMRNKKSIEHMNNEPVTKIKRKGTIEVSNRVESRRRKERNIPQPAAVIT
jgi:hypothetical protein